MAYAGCRKVLEVAPEWKLCGRPVKETAQMRDGDEMPRCELHPMKRIWPD